MSNFEDEFAALVRDHTAVFQKIDEENRKTPNAVEMSDKSENSESIDDQIPNFVANMNKDLKAQLKAVKESGKPSQPTQLLIADLEAARTAENSAGIDKMIEEAKKERYHDFFCGMDSDDSFSDDGENITRLVQHLTNLGLTKMAQDAVKGKYDA